MPIETIRFVCGNLEVNRMRPYKPGEEPADPRYGPDAGQQQLQRIQALRPDVLLVQEQTSKWLDDYCRAGWPHLADKTIRFLKCEPYDCRQVIAVHSGPELPINDHFAADFGYLHPDGKEHVEILASLGRQVRACALAAEIEIGPDYSFLAITTHGPWIARADEGILYPHQELYFSELGVWLEELREKRLPMVLSGDFNARILDILPLMPKWLRFVTPYSGTSLDLLPDHPRRQQMEDSNVYVDGVFVYQATCHNVEVLTGLSDHKLHLVELSFD